MKKFSYALIVAAALCAQAWAQTPAGAGARTAAPAPAARPAGGAPADGAACGCEDRPLPDVLAVVNSVKITPNDLSAETTERVRQLQQTVVDARARELNLQIDSMLLEAESKKRGVSSLRVIEDEIVSKTPEPTGAEAQAFYDQNKSRIQGEFKDVSGQIVGYLREQRQQEQAKKLAERLRAAAQVKIFVPAPTPPATAAERARVLAAVNGRNITSGNIEDSLRASIFSVQEQVYALRRQDVELKINDTLLMQEAQKRGVTTRALLDAEVIAKVPATTEAQAQAFYNQNKERVNGDFPQLKDQIIRYLREESERKAQSDFAARLRGAASVQTFLTAPEPPVFQISVDDQPSKGSPAAAVTVVEFTDFQCPSCAQQHPILERLVSEYGDRVRLVVRDFPLSQHADAVKAAEAAEAAREQGKYWDYVAILFRNQSALGVPKLKEYATALGLDRPRFDAALDGGKFTESVRRDVLEGHRVGVSGTPALYVNGRRAGDRSYEGLKATIEAALKSTAK